MTPHVSITSCIRAAETASCLLEYLSSFLRTLKPDKVGPRKERQKLTSFMSKHGKVLNETHASLPLRFHWTEHTWHAAIQETQFQSLGQEDSPGEGNGNPLQYSCLGNPHGQRSLMGHSPWEIPMDRGAWWALCCRKESGHN